MERLLIKSDCVMINVPTKFGRLQKHPVYVFDVNVTNAWHIKDDTKKNFISSFP
jgi:hypothetical protein